jgi:alkyl hydroperoxide reductase subunit AhpC
MATMILSSKPVATAELAHERVVSLRNWLDGNWGAVFSNANDFAPSPTTPPGFLTCIAQAVLAAGIKPIAFDRSLDLPLSSWLDHAINDDSLVVINSDGEDLIDLAEYALAMQLDGLRQPFVSLIDERGRVRMTVRYRSRAGERSMADVIALVTALRNGSLHEARELSASVA